MAYLPVSYQINQHMLLYHVWVCTYNEYDKHQDKSTFSKLMKYQRGCYQTEFSFIVIIIYVNPVIIFRLSSLLMLSIHRAVEVESSRDERKMTKGLRCVAELLPGPGNFLAEHGVVIGEAKHVLEDIHCAHEVFLIVAARACQRFH